MVFSPPRHHAEPASVANLAEASGPNIDYEMDPELHGEAEVAAGHEDAYEPRVDDVVAAAVTDGSILRTGLP